MNKILIIEDDELLGDLLLKKINSAGFDGHLARDGAKGLVAIEELMPDLIILDIFLPTLNGFEILTQKRHNVKTAAIPVIVLTNSLEQSSASSVENLGAVDFVIKSNLTQDEVLDRVKNILNKKTKMNQEPSQKEDVLHGKKILVVEDDKFLGSILISRLTGRNISPIYAKTGEEALEELKKQTPDAVLLDILLPGIDGFEVLKQIRANPNTAKIPVMVLSNFNQVADKEKAESMQAQFLVKALVDPDEIVGKLEEVFRVV